MPQLTLRYGGRHNATCGGGKEPRGTAHDHAAIYDKLRASGGRASGSGPECFHEPRVVELPVLPRNASWQSVDSSHHGIPLKLANLFLAIADILLYKLVHLPPNLCCCNKNLKVILLASCPGGL